MAAIVVAAGYRLCIKQLAKRVPAAPRCARVQPPGLQSVPGIPEVGLSHPLAGRREEGQAIFFQVAVAVTLPVASLTVVFS